jgi:hypothetical protein
LQIPDYRFEYRDPNTSKERKLLLEGLIKTSIAERLKAVPEILEAGVVEDG